MLIRLLQGGMLLMLTVVIHTVVLSGMIHHFFRHHADREQLGTFAFAWLLTRFAALTVLAHLLEVAIWAAFYAWKGALPDLETSLYFSSVTFATIGYGDVVLPPTWRLLAAMEGLTGILMCSWSGALLIGVISRLHPRTRSDA